MESDLSVLFHDLPWLLPLIYALFGLCIGSYLNVVIYRLPRGLSTHQPKHSFCPRCEKPIAWYHNIPLLSWLYLRGRSACCQQAISWRYPLIELATAVLIAALVVEKQAPAYHYAALALLCLWGAALIVIIAMDWQEMIVMPSVTIVASLAGTAALCLDPQLMPLEKTASWSDALLYSATGMACGYTLLKLVAWLGQLLLGRRSQHYSTPQSWELKASEDGEDILLRVGGEELRYSELLMESRDRLHLRKAQLLACQQSSRRAKQALKPLAPSDITLDGSHMSLSDGTRLALEGYDSLSGTCAGWACRRSVLGSGDAWIVMAMGAVCGWQGALFCLFGGSIIGLLIALIMRLGRGRAMPFGPSLVLAALLWVFGASSWPAAYLALFE